MHNFRELKVWNRSRELVKQVYQLTNSFPKSEQFGLTNQIRRSSISVPSNIAEGCGRNTNAQLNHFIDVAHGSSCELETQLILSNDLGFTAFTSIEPLIQNTHKIQKMLFGLKKRLNSKL